MKRIVLAIGIMLVFASLVFAAIVDTTQGKQRFTAKFTITYNAITLSEVAELEDKIKREFGDSCRIDVQLITNKEINNEQPSFSTIMINPTDPNIYAQ